MSEPVKKKLCWNCEGSVAKQLETCPYCGVYLSPTEHDGQPEERNLLTPPYPRESLKAEAIPAPPYQGEGEEEKVLAQEEEGSMLPPLIFLLAGVTFLLFGVTLWLFSEGGRLTLSWNADWGLMFMLLGVPLLFFGLRSLLRLE